jgi:tetratricopeptide (TPR) repeat protein
LPGARQRYSEALAAARATGSERSTAVIALNLAEAEFCGGNADEALRLADEALGVLRAGRDPRNVAILQDNMAAYLVALRRYDEARTAAREALSAARDAQFSVGLAWTLQHLAAIAVLRTSADVPVVEDCRRAARILGYADARLSALEVLRGYTEQQEYDAMIPALRDALDGDELSKLMAEGSTWNEDQAVAEAMLV